MAESPSARAWTDDQILDVFGEADAVFARDGQAGGTDAPGILARRPAGARVPSWADQISELHPDDRVASVELWWNSMQRPAELQELSVRSRVGNEWRLIGLRSVNLLHQPGVRAVLIGSTDLGPTVVHETRDTPSRGDASAWTYQEVDPVGTVLRTEGDAIAVFGRDADALTGTNIVELLHPDGHESAIGMWVELMASPGAARGIRLQAVHPNGERRWIESTVTNRLEDPLGAMVVISLDISERYAQEGAVRASQEEFRTLAEEVPIAVFRATADGRVTFGNGRWFHLTSFVGVVEFLIDLVAIENRSEWRERWAMFTSADGTDTVTLEYSTPDHRSVLSAHCRRVHAQGSEPTFVGVLSDMTDTAALRHRADHDSLTGLLNREAFDRALAATLEVGQSAVVAFIDLDGFKELNDALGHEAGDHVLAEVSRRLTGSVRPGDAVGRYGGDEFVVLCSGLPDRGADDLRKRITHALTPAVEWQASEWPLHASIGTAQSTPGDEVTDVVRRADHAMYEDKRARRKRSRSGWWAAGSVS